MDEQASSSTTSPQKRKFSEYHDPDYHNALSPNNNAEPASKRQMLDNTTATTTETQNTNENEQTRRHKVIANIITLEFDNEIVLKKQQLELIDKRLAEARKLLDRLRYSIVAEYYRKQEVPLTKPDADAIRGGNTQTLFNDERAGPQIPLHPSLKKIIGKKPKSYAELLSTKPERTAAAQAKRTIRARNPAQKRHERRIQQMIREQGIVIDHTKEQTCYESINVKAEPHEDEDNRPSTSKFAQMKAKAASNKASTATPGKVLNATRINNKVKYYFVVGNTSKYIGADAETRGNGQVLSHKWLVYVQGKDMPQPIEKYIKKVRFHLHHSYRPNDIVDVHLPPFQISRRGWGEFPMRIQLYFHEALQQKPVQLLHNLVLDKTRSGLHTLGAETVVEVWLRTEKPTTATTTTVTTGTINAPSVTSPMTFAAHEESSKPRTISITHNKEELDDTLFAFLNKIDVSPDIEKIQPTVVVPEPLACKLSSPKKLSPPTPNKQSTSKLQTPQKATTFDLERPITEPMKTANARPQTHALMPTAAASKPAVVYLPKMSNGATTTGSHNQQSTLGLGATTKAGSTIVVNGKKFILSNNTKTTLSTNGTSNRLTMMPTSSARLEQTMLRRTNVNYPRQLDSNVTKWSTNVESTKTQKNIVFQREGKLYIIDPMQMKLKQAQKKQESLLKPQVSLLKPKQKPETLTQAQLDLASMLHSIASDHDYAPTPPALRMTLPSAVTTTNTHPPPPPTIITVPNSMPPPIQTGKRLSADALCLLLQKQRLQLEQRFHRMDFVSMRAAVEYLLRRLPIIAEPGTPAAAFAHVCRSLSAFQACTVIKQRACEWLRAKVVQRFMRNHKQLQVLAAAEAEHYWSIREILMFARFYAYTPSMKTFSGMECNNKQTTGDVSVAPFAALVQNELQQAQQQIQYETLSANVPLAAWVEQHCKQLAAYEYNINDQQPIDVVGIELAKPKSHLSTSIASSPIKSNCSHLLYLPLPAHLDNAAQLVGDVCKSTGVHLQANEEFTTGVLHPAALTALSQAMQIFVEKLLRQTIANKLQQQQQQQQQSIGAVSNLAISPQDIVRVIAQCAEFDFLSNSHLGVADGDNKP